MNFVYEEQLLKSISFFIDAIDMDEISSVGDLCKSLAMFFKEMLIERSKSIQESKTPKADGKIDVDFLLSMIKTMAGSDDKSIKEFILRITENKVSAETKYQFFDLLMYNAGDANSRNDRSKIINFGKHRIQNSKKLVVSDSDANSEDSSALFLINKQLRNLFVENMKKAHYQLKRSSIKNHESEKTKLTNYILLNNLQKIYESSEDVEKKRNKIKASLLIAAFKKNKDIMFKEIKNMLAVSSFSDDANNDIIIAKITELLNDLSQMKESLNKIKSTYPEAKVEDLEYELITCEKLLNVDCVLRIINKEFSIKYKEVVELKLRLSELEEISTEDVRKALKVVEESLNLVSDFINTFDRECLDAIDESSQFFVVKKNFIDLENKFKELQIEKNSIKRYDEINACDEVYNSEIGSDDDITENIEMHTSDRQSDVGVGEDTDLKKSYVAQNKKKMAIEILYNTCKFLSNSLAFVFKINEFRMSFVSAINFFKNPDIESFINIFSVVKILTGVFSKFTKPAKSSFVNSIFDISVDSPML